MRFCLSLYADRAAAEASTPEQAAAELERYVEVTSEMARAGVLVSGEALLPGQQAVSVGASAADDRRGPVHDDPELSGFYVLDCDGPDEAIAWARRLPVVEHGLVEVRPVMDWPDPAEA